MSLPTPQLSNATAFRKLMHSKAGTVKCARLTWVEPVVSTTYGHTWALEYTYHGEMTVQYLREFAAKFDRLTDTKTINIFSNKLDRITLHIEDVPDPVVTKRSEEVKDDPKPSNRQRKRNEWHKRQRSLKSGIGFVKGETLNEVQTPPEKEEPAPLNKTPSEPTIEKKTDKVQQRDEPERTTITTPNIALINPQPIVKLTQDLPEYAMMRLRDSRIYDLVRNYLAYFKFTTENQIIDGDSKISAAMKIKSEGLPLGDALYSLYTKFCVGYGMDEAEVAQDLETLKAFHSTSRLIRLQTARQFTKAYYGLKGGDPIHCSIRDTYKPLYPGAPARSMQDGDIPIFALE